MGDVIVVYIMIYNFKFIFSVNIYRIVNISGILRDKTIKDKLMHIPIKINIRHNTLFRIFISLSLAPGV